MKTKDKISSDQYEPLEEILQQFNQGQFSSLIGIPKETVLMENRVSLTPEAVGILSDFGVKILIEKNAGVNSGYSNQEYINHGAAISLNAKSVFNCPIILKSAPLTLEEVSLIKNGALIISPIHYSLVKKELIMAMLNKQVLAMSYEKFCDRHGSLPLVKSMSEIAGLASIFIASQYLNKMNNGTGTLLGGITGIPPTNIVIIGAGTVGEFASRSALSLGAAVKIFDNEIYRLKRLESRIGQRVWTSIIEPNILLNSLKEADIAIGALHSFNGKTPLVVTSEMVYNMKKGSVIIDIAIDKGGCFETSKLTTHINPIWVKNDIIHYAVPNIPSAYPRTASQAISNVLLPFLTKLFLENNIEDLIKLEPHWAKGFYLYKGVLTDEFLHKKLGIPFKQIKELIN